MKQNSIIRLISIFVLMSLLMHTGAKGLDNKNYTNEDKKLIQGRTTITFYHKNLNSTILINGSFDPGPWHTKFVELWKWNNTKWELISDSGPEVRNNFSWAYDDNRNVLTIYGGSLTIQPGNRKLFSDTWEWDGVNWSKVETSSNPGERLAHKMVYDPVRKACVLFGGINNKMEGMGDTWMYKEKKWTQIFNDGPSGRWPAAMFYYPKTKKIYVYGGISRKKFSDPGGNMGDTWELNENGWKEIKPSNSPGIRESAVVVFNGNLNTMWMVAGGGVTPETKFQNTTWSFDGKDWKEIKISGLSPRGEQGLSYNPITKSVMVTGGVNIGGGTKLNDVWVLEHKRKEWKCISGCVEELKQWISEHPEDVSSLLNYVSTLYWTNNPQGLSDFVSELTTRQLPRNSYQRLGAYLISIKKHKEAITCYEKALSIEPRAIDFYNVACLYSLLGEKDKAFEALTRAIESGYYAKDNIEADSDLASLKTDNRWKNLMEKLEAVFAGPTPYKRAHHEMVYDEAGKSVWMISGSTPLAGGQAFKFFNDIWKYTSSGWVKVGSSGDERSGIRLAFDTKRNKMYSFGGFTKNNQSSGQLRTLENGEWKIVTDLPEMKAAEAGFVYDSDRDKFIAFGETIGGTWEWDGNNWKKFEGAQPDLRQSCVMVYDTKRKRTVLYGGSGANRKKYGDTWEFDGKTWTKVSESGPGSRMTCGYAYDSKRGMLIIFGGMDENKIWGDTWGWNGITWEKLSDIGPAPRMMGYMAYDKSRDKVVLFGGRLGYPNDVNDTWEWDGKVWTEIKK